MNIKKILSITIALILISATFAGCRKMGGDDMSSGNTSNLSSTVYDVVDIVENESSDTESVDSTASDDAQSTVTSDENNSNTSSDEIFTENIVSVGDGGNSGNNSKVDPEPPKTFIDPEAEQDGKPTYMTSPDANNSVITVDIEAGKSVYYKISSAANRYFTINSPNAYVIYAGKRYDASNGKLSFLVESDQLSSAQILFEIGNKGTQTESFTILFVDPLGSWDNKEVIESIDNEITTKLEEGNEVGYWYKYTVTEKGKIKFYIQTGTENGVLIVTRYRNDVPKSISTDEEEQIKADSTGAYIQLDVKAGDEIVVNVGSKENGGVKYPAAVIKWMMQYV